MHNIVSVKEFDRTTGWPAEQPPGLSAAAGPDSESATPAQEESSSGHHHRPTGQLEYRRDYQQRQMRTGTRPGPPPEAGVPVTRPGPPASQLDLGRAGTGRAGPGH